MEHRSDGVDADRTDPHLRTYLRAYFNRLSALRSRSGVNLPPLHRLSGGGWGHGRAGHSRDFELPIWEYCERFAEAGQLLYWSPRSP